MKFCKANDTTFLILDFGWYASKQEEIDQWCLQAFDYQPRNGMVLQFISTSDIVLFLLKWQ